MAEPQSGCICLHRQIKSHWLWPGVKGSRYSKFEAWIYLLLSTNHQARKIDIGSKLIIVGRGQLLTSQVALARRWSWHRETVSQFLYQLKADGMLGIETSKHTSTGYTLLTICNYDKYQDIEGRASDIQFSDTPQNPDIQTDNETDIHSPGITTENINGNLNQDIQHPASKPTSKPASNQHPPYTNNNENNVNKGEEGYELHRSSLPPAPPQPGKNGNRKDWGKRDWIPFFLHNQDYVPGFPVEYLLTPQWWHNLFEQYPKQIGPGTLERAFAFMGRHFIEQPSKRPKSKKGYLQKTANLIRIQLERDERANGDRTDLSWLEPQSDFLKKYFAERSSSEGS